MVQVLEFTSVEFPLGMEKPPIKKQQQVPCPQDFNMDALFHVSVSVKRIFL